MPIRKDNILNKSEITIAFSNIEMILHVNQEFLALISNPKEDIAMGQAFLKVVSIFVDLF